MRASIAKALLLGCALLATAASAGQDEFGLGTGSGTNDALSVTSSDPNPAPVIVNKYAKLTRTVVSNGVTVLEVEPDGGGIGTLFAQGDLVMVLQMGDATPGSGTALDVNLATSGVGQWELARVATVNTGPKSLTLDRLLTGTYVANRSQVILVPEYSTVSVSGTGILSAKAWDHDKRIGGVLAFLATGAVSVIGNGKIQVDGLGFKGGTPEEGDDSENCTSETNSGPSTAARGEGVYFDVLGEGLVNLANGAGGGVCKHSGGGGGGNGGKGGRGGNAEDGDADTGGQGGARLTAALLSDRLTFGGGGGSGHGSEPVDGGAGGAGGGILFMRAASLNVASTARLSASGAAGASSEVGAGGGGAGGTLHVRLGGAATCTKLDAKGGAGGNNTSAALAPGGGGGGGRVFLQAASSTCNPSALAGLAGTTSTGVNFGATPAAADVSEYSGPVLVLPQKYERPSAPTVESPASNAFIQEVRPTVSGFAAPNAEVWLYVDSRSVQKTTTDGSGRFITQLAAPDLGPGAHQLQAAAVYLGAVGVKSAARTFTVDDTPPPLALDADVVANATTRSTTATFTFSSTEANVTFFCELDPEDPEDPEDYQPCASPWSVTVGQGAHKVWVKAVDAALRVAQDSHSWTVDSVPPDAPVILVPGQGGAPVKVTASLPLVLSGTADPGSTISIYLDNSASPVAPPATAAALTGNWTWSPADTALQTEGPHVATAVASDTAGNASAPSAVRAFSIDKTAPMAPTVSSPLVGARLKTVEFTVMGSAEAGSSVTVQVRRGTSTGTLVTSNTGTVNAVGLWSVDIDMDGSPPTSINDGEYTLVVSVTDTAGFPNNPPNPNTEVSFNLDRVGPTVTFPNNPGLRTRSLVAVFEFSTGPLDPVTAYSCKLDSEDFDDCTNPYIVSVDAGDHTLQVQATDVAGNVSDPASFSWTVDTTPPGAPSVTFPAENGLPVTSLRPTFTGTAEAGSTVTLYVDGVPLVTSPATTTVTGSNPWSATPAADLAPGFHILTATATDDVGNVGPFSVGRSFVVDATEPAAPQFTYPAAGETVFTTTPTLRGTAEAGATVRVSINGVLIGSTTANAANEWALPVTTALAQGTRTATATATDSNSRTGPATNPALTFVVDTTPPVAPELTGPAPLVNTAKPTVSGTAEPLSKVKVFIDGALVGTVIAGSGAGNWSLELPIALHDGSYSAQASATDAGGFEGVKSAGRGFTVDTTNPAAPTLTVPAANASLPTAQPVFGGRAEPGATVEVRVDGNVVGTVLVPVSGDWTLTSSTLGETIHTATATARDAAGNTSTASATVPFRVDLTAPGTPTIRVPGQGEFVGSASPTVSGTAEPGSRVNLLVDTIDRGQVTANGAGDWSMVVPVTLTDGGHTLRVRATDAAGNSNDGSLSEERIITVDTVAPDTRIVKGPDLVDVSPTAKFVVRAQNANQSTDTNTVAFDCSTDGGPFANCPSTVANTDPALPGTYVVTLSDVAIGDHLVLIRARDRAGNTDSTPATYSWRVVKGDLNVQVEFGPKDPTNQTTATFIFKSDFPRAGYTGTVTSTRPGAEPRLFTVPSGSNTTSFENLLDAQYTLTVHSVNPDTGDLSMSPAQHVWTVDTGKPSAPTIAVPGDGQRMGTPTPTFSGTGEAGGTVEVRVNNALVGSKVVDSEGRWTLVVTTGLIEGPYTFTARIIDRATTPSDPTPPRTFYIDFTRPVVTAEASPPPATNEATASFRFNVSEAVTGYVCKLDNVPLPTCATSANPTVSFSVSEGPHTLTVTATDLAGNANDPPFTHSWRMDKTAPTVTIKTKPPEQSGSRLAVFGFDSPESPVAYQCSVDGSGFGECAASFSVPDLQDGPHIVQVKARDLAGNTTLEPEEYRWSVDTTSPDAPVLTAPEGTRPVGERKPLFKGTAEANSTVSVQVDGAAVASTFVGDSLGRWEVASDVELSEGTHSVRLVARDRAGNVSAVSEPVEFLMDTTGPETEITSGPDKRLRAVTASFTFASEEGASFECSLDRGAFVACPGDGTFKGLEEGGHSLEVRAFDVAGNRDPSPATYAWRVYLGNDIRTRGGGLSCAATADGGGPTLALLGLGGLVLLGARRRRR